MWGCGEGYVKRLSFSTFLVDDSNRDAFEVCSAVAELEPVSPQPVLLLGEEGCGKTHLLYAIVNRVRSSTARTGLAYVTAHDFREEVRGLIADPTPLDKVSSAILLVDQLEQFTELTEELEAVVQIFLDKGYNVVLASNRHPARLTNITAGLRAAVERGRTIEILTQGDDTRVELLTRQARQEAEATLARQRDEIRELHALVERLAKGGKPPAAPAADLAREHEARAQAEAEAIRLREENEGLRRELDRRADAEEEVEQLREALTAARSAEGEDIEQLTRGHAEQTARLEAEIERLKSQLEAAQTDTAQARHEANLLLQRAEKLLSQIEANRVRFTELEEEHRKRVRELEAQVEAGVGGASAEELETARARLEESESKLAELREGFARERHELAERLTQMRERLEAELDTARADAQRFRNALDDSEAQREELALALNREQAEAMKAQAAAEELRHERDAFSANLADIRADRDQLQEAVEQMQRALDAAVAETDGLRVRLEEGERRLAERAAEMDALRHEAAAQVARANAQAGELEGRLARLECRHERLKKNSERIVGALRRLGSDLVTSAETLADLAEDLAQAELNVDAAIQLDIESWEPAAQFAAAAPAAQWHMPTETRPGDAPDPADDPAGEEPATVADFGGEAGNTPEPDARPDEPTPEPAAGNDPEPPRSEWLPPPGSLLPLRELSPLEDESDTLI